MKNQKTIIIVLSVLLVIAVLFIGMMQIRAYNTSKLQAAYQQGGQTGYEQAVISLMQQLSTCQQVPLHAGNNTITAVAVECLQQAQQAE